MDCKHCGEPLTGDQRIDRWLGGAVHLECGARMILGSVGHQQGKCGCFIKEGPTEDDPPGLTRREAAIAAYRLALGR